MFTPDALEFGGGVRSDDRLDILDVALVEGRWFSILEDHEVGILLGREG